MPLSTILVVYGSIYKYHKSADEASGQAIHLATGDDKFGQPLIWACSLFIVLPDFHWHAGFSERRHQWEV